MNTRKINLPTEYDEAEPEATAHYEFNPMERATRDYPGNDAYVTVYNIVLLDGTELDCDALSDDYMIALENRILFDYGAELAACAAEYDADSSEER